MPDFFNHFPPEVIAEIISHISQPDSIKCLRVCHRWNDELPAHSQQLWRKVSIIDEKNEYSDYSWLNKSDILLDKSNALWDKSNVLWEKSVLDCLAKYLGPHVQEVILHSLAPVSKILNTLADLSCAITVLEINEIRKKQYSAEYVTNAIPLFKNTLTELTIEGYAHDIPLTRLLRSLTKLTHLTLVPHDGRYGINTLAYHTLESNTNNSCGFSSNLVYLHMGTARNFRYTLDTILSLCPKLRALAVSREYSREDRSLENCDLLDSRCPLLRYLLWDMDKSNVMLYHKAALDRWKIASKSSCYDKEIGTLREIIYAIDSPVNRTIVPLLDRSQQQLMVANFHIYRWSWDADSVRSHIKAITRLQFPQLKHLLLHTLPEEANQWVDLVVGCKQLESIYLCMEIDGSLLHNMVKAASRSENLQSLHLSTNSPRACGALDETVGSIISKFSTLQNLHLDAVNVSDQDLLYICGLQTLQTLVLDMYDIEDCISQEGLLEAANQLKVKGSGSQSFEFCSVHNVTDAVLERFGQVESLSKLIIKYSPQVTDQGMLAFIHEPHSGKRSCHLYEYAVTEFDTIMHSREWHS